MSREEAMEALIESGMELRRDDIELGKKLERERIIKAWDLEMDCDCDNAFLHMRSRIAGEQK